MMKKYTMRLLFVLVLLIIHVPSALAADIIDSGECGNDLTWVLDDNGVLTISGHGAMDNYDSYSSVPWYSNQDDILSVVIGDGVTNIGKYAFASCKNLMSVAISNSVTSIGVSAFSDCNKLKSVAIPDSVTTIEFGAFRYCINIENITFPDRVTSIGQNAFERCISLKSITIPNGITRISSDVFADCSGLINVTIPNSVMTIDLAAFSGCVSLGSIRIPNSVTDIGNYAFAGCTGLKNVAISYSATRIGAYSFKGCIGLTNITIPNSVTTIEFGAFMDCSGLTNVTIQNGVSTIDGYVFSGCTELRNITIPTSVTSIANNVFEKCVKLLDIAIPSSITKIRSETFKGCTGLTTIIIPNSVTSVGEHAFGECTGLENITISNGVTSIEKKTFYKCVSLKEVSIPNGVSIIDDEAFYECSSLANIRFPNSLTEVGEGVFAYCGNLKDVYYDGNQQQWDSIEIGTNFYLEHATIHYSNYSKLNGIEQYSYSFANEALSFGYPYGYRIPLERFQLIFGKTALAKQKYGQAFAEGQYWSGSCYGMSTTAGMFATDGNNVNVTAFRSSATCPGDLLVADTNTEWGLTLTQFIEAMQISQYSSMCAMAQQQNKNRLSALTSAVSTYDNGGGGPVVICVYGSDRNGLFSGHALLAYHLDGQKIYVYDSNYPNDGTRAVTISDSGWSYTIADGLTWSSANGSITYVPYETYLSDWTNRGHVPVAAYVSLVADVSDAVISDSKGEEMAVFQRGKIVQGSENAYPVTQLGITADGVSTVPPQIAVWLPADEVYTITNRDTSKSSFEVSLYNVNHGVSVQTNAHSVRLLAEDATGTTSAVVESEFCDYSITQIAGLDEVTFQGKTGRDKFVSMIENGFSIMRSGLTASTSVTLNGRSMPSDSLPNGTAAVNISTSRFIDVSEGQYFYAPVQWAVWNGITNGTSATTFSPQNTCSRNHILTFLWRANGCPTASIPNPFTDINPDADFGKAAVWAYEEGLVSGKQFNGGTPCTRSDVVTYLWKLAGRPTAGRNGFTDVPSNADYAQAVSWAVERGITKGTTATTFNPSVICTRGQIVTFLHRAYAGS